MKAKAPDISEEEFIEMTKNISIGTYFGPSTRDLIPPSDMVVKKIDKIYLPDSIATKEYVDTHQTINISTTLPTPSQELRGKILIVPDENNNDQLYICLKTSGKYIWKKFDDNTSSSTTTSILGQATLGSMILGKE